MKFDIDLVGLALIVGNCSQACLVLWYLRRWYKLEKDKEAESR